MKASRVLIILIVAVAFAFLVLNAATQFLKVTTDKMQPPVRNLTKLVSESVSLRCGDPNKSSSAMDPHHVNWLKDGVTIVSNSSKESRVFQKKEILQINRINKSDSGLYECTLTSNATRDIRSGGVFLNIEYPAEPINAPEEVHLAKDSHGIVPCPIDANPPVKLVMWIKNKYLFDTSDGQGYDIADNGSLILKRVKESDEGVYKCMPYNIHGTLGASSEIKVIVYDSTI